MPKWGEPIPSGVDPWPVGRPKPSGDDECSVRRIHGQWEGFISNY